ncbi:unnamed protein product [Nesidiocoris tenuis]|uniref:dolichyl-P-Man:Man5GlcNAc2-PP-dolichol alpha-1,3-mannosyltransferase n=1 Tax=Nesidiocoris tenuis TaxID=355587 RepID=A0A6H5G0S9_9HEMI|nr:unnamed protein product [Nesidiocoris tenuis]
MGKNVKKKPNTFLQTMTTFRQKYCNLNFVKQLIFTSNYLKLVSVVLILVDAILCLVVVHRIKYTEIDWIAYMQEVEGFLNGTFDYSQLKDGGKNVRTAQYIFVLLYVVLLALVFRIYIRTKKVPAYVLVLMTCTTYRIHSIFILRLFNDPIATILFYASLNLFLDNRWSLGSAVYSLAVGVKMNILLYAPALLIAYLCCLGWKRTIYQISICASVQLFLGAPFLLENPYAYLKGSFDLGRIFMHKWTVNWRFLPEHIFINPLFHVALLAAHVGLICAFVPIMTAYIKSYARLKMIETDLNVQSKKKPMPIDMGSVAQLLVFPMFVTNFIGIVVSRSLHYQFYVWYYHSLPYLLWCTELSVKTRLTILGLIELCWNTYPSTDLSSALLHLSHLLLLFNLYKTSRSRSKME